MQFFIHCNFFCQKCKFTYLLTLGLVVSQLIYLPRIYILDCSNFIIKLWFHVCTFIFQIDFIDLLFRKNLRFFKKFI